MHFIHSDWGNVHFFETLALKKSFRKFELHPKNQPTLWPFFSTFLTIILHSEPPKNLFLMPWDWLVGIHTIAAISWSLQLNFVEPQINRPEAPSAGHVTQALWSTDSVGPETMPGLWAEAGFEGKVVHRKSQVSKWHPKLSNNHWIMCLHPYVWNNRTNII